MSTLAPILGALPDLGKQQSEEPVEVVAIAGWIEPPDRSSCADYWLTRRNGNAVDGYGGFSDDVRVKYRWAPSEGAWITGIRTDRQGRPDAVMSCLHSNNGWRLEGEA